MVDIEIMGKKWSSNILYLLKNGPNRFNKLMEELSTSNNRISSKSLADRLKDLEEQGLIDRQIVNSRPPSTEYIITKKGLKSIDLMIQLSKL